MDTQPTAAASSASAAAPAAVEPVADAAEPPAAGDAAEGSEVPPAQPEAESEPGAAPDVAASVVSTKSALKRAGSTSRGSRVRISSADGGVPEPDGDAGGDTGGPQKVLSELPLLQGVDYEMEVAAHPENFPLLETRYVLLPSSVSLSWCHGLLYPKRKTILTFPFTYVLYSSPSLVSLEFS